MGEEANSPGQMRAGQKPIMGVQRYRISSYPGTDLPARANKVRPPDQKCASSPGRQQMDITDPGTSLPQLDLHRPQHPDLNSIPLMVPPASKYLCSFRLPLTQLPYPFIPVQEWCSIYIVLSHPSP